MFFKIHVLYIDEARGVYGVTDEKAEENQQLIIKACQEYGFQYTILPLERAFELQRDSLNEASEDMDAAKYKTPGLDLPSDGIVKFDQPERLADYRQKL